MEHRPISRMISRGGEDELLSFHQIHGKNLELSANGRVASRKQGFDRALCPISPSISKHRTYFLRITKTNENWKGGLSIALSAELPRNGKDLPRNAAEGGVGSQRLVNDNSPANAASGGWLFVRIQLRNQQMIGSWISFRVDVNTSPPLLRYGVNGELESSEPIDDACLMNCIDMGQDIWALVDVFGAVTEVELLGVYGIHLTFRRLA